MKKILIAILLFFVHTLLIAQDRFWIIKDTRLYEKPSTTSNFFGYFKYGAEVEILEDKNIGWLKVKSDNFTVGYVKKDLIRTSMSGYDKNIVDASNPIIVGGDGIHGGNHLFVTVAGLKVRSLPNKSATIKQILLNGEAVSVDYIPVNPEEWVNIGTSFDPKYAQFVQAKYLGKRPIYEDLISKFDKLEKSNISERKTIAERLVELSYNSEREKELPALNRFLEVAKQLNDKQLIETTKFNIFIANNIPIDKDFSKIEEYLKNAEFELNGLASESYMISYTNLIKKFGKPTEIKTEEIGCDSYISPVIYYYPEFIISVDKENNKAELVEVFFNNTTKFILNPKDIITQEITEKDFVLKYGNYLNFSFREPHNYSFPLDSGNIIVYFKNGKLFSIEIIYYC